MLETAFLALGDNGVGRFLAASTPTFAAIQSLHLLGLALLGGAALVTDLSALRIVLRKAEPAHVAASLFPVFLTGLVLMALSGLLLISAGPLKYWLNPLFGPKLLALSVAVTVQLLLYPGELKRTSIQPTMVAKFIAVSSVAMWVSVAVIGRWVGLI